MPGKRKTQDDDEDEVLEEDEEEEEDDQESEDDESEDDDDEGDDDEDSSDDEDKKKLRRTIQKLRPFERRFKAMERENKKLKAEQVKQKRAGETEQQKKLREADEAIAENQKLRSQLQQRELRSFVSREARRQGAVDEDAVFALIDPNDFDVDEDTGRPTNVKELVKDVLKRKKYLRGSAQEDDDRPAPRTPRRQAGTGEARQSQSENDALDRLRGRSRYNAL